MGSKEDEIYFKAAKDQECSQFLVILRQLKDPKKAHTVCV